MSYLPLPVDNAGKPVPVGSESGRIQMPAMDQPVPNNWVTLTGRFFIVYAINIPLLDPMTLLSPDSRNCNHFVIKAQTTFKASFFGDILKKTQAQKTLVPRKLKPNFREKLNEPEDF